MRLVAVLALLVLTVPSALAQGPPPIDVHIGIDQGSATVEGAGVELAGVTPGEEYRFTLNLTKEYTTFEVQASGLAIERPHQLVPHLRIDAGERECARVKGSCEYTLFEQFPDDEIWDIDGVARVFFTNGTATDVVLRLGIPGPVNATLVLVRDVTAPGFTVHPYGNVTTFSFYQETSTEELAIGDLQVRPAGSTGEWVVNPTPMFHFRQRFPVQGLDANTTYDARVVFRDWAGNTATSVTYQVRTMERPVVAAPEVRAISPLPDATVGQTGVVVKAEWSDPLNVTRDGVRVFFDKKEITEGIVYRLGEVTYEPPTPLARGAHSVAIEVQNAEGGLGIARWTFSVGGSAVPGSGLLAVLATGAVVAIAVRPRRS